MKSSVWKYFKIKNFFDIEAGKYHYKDEYSEGSTPYCSASASNNGVARWIDLPPDFDGNKIITGKVGCTAFYEPDAFCATSDCNVLTPKFDMDEKIALFIVTVINKDQNYRWNYGRQCRVGNMKKMQIKLPATEDDQPDRNYMRECINSLHSKKIRTQNHPLHRKFDISSWKEYKLKDIAEIRNGRGITKEEIQENPGSFPAVQSGEDNNGVMGYISKKYCKEMKYVFSEKTCLTVARTGTSGFVAVQKDGCVVGDSAKIIKLKDSVPQNIEVYIFIATLLNENRFKYAYGRKVIEKKYLNTVIKLPINENNEPDWNKIIDYIGKLPYGDLI